MAESTVTIVGYIYVMIMTTLTGARRIAMKKEKTVPTLIPPIKINEFKSFPRGIEKPREFMIRNAAGDAIKKRIKRNVTGFAPAS